MKPQLILGADGAVDKCRVTGIILEEGDKADDETVLDKFKATGQQRVFVLAEASCPENRTNMEIILNSLNLPNLSQDYQLVMDLKLINIVLGIQTCTSMFGCPFCESFKTDANGNPTNKRGTYVQNATMRTINNITANNEEYLRHGNGDRSKLKDYKSFTLSIILLERVNDLVWA